MIITLTPEEIFLARTFGGLRRIDGIRGRCRPKHGCSGSDLWGQDSDSTAAEIAVAKATHRYWSGAVYRSLEDVAGGLQVRQTDDTHNNLIIRPHESEAAIYVLVIGACPRFDIRGWVYGHEGKRGSYLHAPNGRPAAYFVPAAQLHPIDTLPLP